MAKRSRFFLLSTITYKCNVLIPQRTNEQEAGFLIISIRLDYRRLEDAMSSSRCRNSSIKLNSTWGTIPRQIGQQCAGSCHSAPFDFNLVVKCGLNGPGLDICGEFYNICSQIRISTTVKFQDKQMESEPLFSAVSIWSQNQTSDNRLHLLANIPPHQLVLLPINPAHALVL